MQGGVLLRQTKVKPTINRLYAGLNGCKVTSNAEIDQLHEIETKCVVTGGGSDDGFEHWRRFR